MAADTQFVALGGIAPDGTAVTVGFLTDGTSGTIDIGADVQGNSGGIKAETDNNGPNTDAIAGFHGGASEGGCSGVRGTCVTGGGNTNFGLVGTSDVGVYGVTLDFDPGFFPGGNPPPTPSDGVLGDGPANGVHGRSGNTGVRGEGFGLIATGVHGIGFAGEFSGGGATGVLGEGDLVGVHGRSTAVGGRGGVFEAPGASAQVRLVPAPAGTKLPVNGLPGDLFAVIEGEARFENFSVQLFLCLGESPGVERFPPVAGPVLWSPIQLGDPVQGG